MNPLTRTINTRETYRLAAPTPTEAGIFAAFVLAVTLCAPACVESCGDVEGDDWRGPSEAVESRWVEECVSLYLGDGEARLINIGRCQVPVAGGGR